MAPIQLASDATASSTLISTTTSNASLADPVQTSLVRKATSTLVEAYKRSTDDDSQCSGISSTAMVILGVSVVVLVIFGGVAFYFYLQFKAAKVEYKKLKAAGKQVGGKIDKYGNALSRKK